MIAATSCLIVSRVLACGLRPLVLLLVMSLTPAVAWAEPPSSRDRHSEGKVPIESIRLMVAREAAGTPFVLLRQTVQPGPAAAPRSGRWKWILLGAGGAAAAVVLATQFGGASSNAEPPVTVTIGQPTVGGPQ